MQLCLDHLYRETSAWDDSVAFWERLGFSFDHRWGEAPHRAGRLVASGAVVVLAEIEAGGDRTSTPFFEVADITALSALADAPIVDTHWGTRMVTVTDPDGRTYRFEERSE